MKKLFISVPMKGRTEEEIKDSIEKMKKIAEVYEGEELELIPSYTKHTPPGNANESIYYLGKSIEKLAHADVFIGIEDPWVFAGCCVENNIADRYNIKRYAVRGEYIIPNFRELSEKFYNEANTDKAVEASPSI